MIRLPLQSAFERHLLSGLNVFFTRIPGAVPSLLPPRLSALSWTVASTCLFAACGGSDLTLPSGSLPAEIRVVDGDAQSGSVGQLLPAPIVVQVTDARGQEVEGTKLEFVLTSAGTGAEIVPSTATTDARGRAQVRMLLGDKAGLQVGEARVVGAGATAPKTTFSAMAVSPGPDNGGPPPAQSNKSPQAAFEVTCQDLTCTFTDQSSDDDGSVVSWQWNFGDQATSTQRNPSHSYQTAGQFAVLLTVRDNAGAANTTAHQADPSAPASPPPPPPPPPANKPPQAEFEVHCSDLRCTFTDRSKDDDGTIVSWRWDFGDGSTSTERSPAHSYRTAGRYQVRLTVTDNDGAGASKTHDAEPSAPPPPPPPPPANKPPEADFDIHCKHLNCTFADRSKDDDGTIVAWHWSFGDGDDSNERNPVHTYDDPGRYDVSLTVTDNVGATDTKTRRADVKK